VFKKSINKNILIIFAIYRTFCIYTNLRVFSSYPDVIFEKYSIKKQENICLFKKLYIIFVKTLSFINYSDRTKYKGKKNFSFKN
jgi:hypothetical protein